jgi:hypothetical protein
MNMSHEVFTCHCNQLLNSSGSVAEICQFCHCALKHEKVMEHNYYCSVISHYCFLQLATLFTSLPVDADITGAALLWLSQTLYNYHFPHTHCCLDHSHPNLILSSPFLFVTQSLLLLPAQLMM